MRVLLLVSSDDVLADVNSWFQWIVSGLEPISSPWACIAVFSRNLYDRPFSAKRVLFAERPSVLHFQMCNDFADVMYWALFVMIYFVDPLPFLVWCLLLIAVPAVIWCIDDVSNTPSQRLKLCASDILWPEKFWLYLVEAYFSWPLPFFSPKFWS